MLAFFKNGTSPFPGPCTPKIIPCPTPPPPTSKIKTPKLQMKIPTIVLETYQQFSFLTFSRSDVRVRSKTSSSVSTSLSPLVLSFSFVAMIFFFFYKNVLNFKLVMSQTRSWLLNGKYHGQMAVCVTARFLKKKGLPSPTKHCHRSKLMKTMTFSVRLARYWKIWEKFQVGKVLLFPMSRTKKFVYVLSTTVPA